MSSSTPDPGTLPRHLYERVRVLASDTPNRDAAQFVLYWMHHGVRAIENPALDAASDAARQLGLPLLVYQGLGGRHPHNNDRHHTFIMQGARDVAAALERDGIRHVFHLGEQAGTPSPLRALARRAALVITEDFPAPPFPRWTAALARACGRPLWCVDTACVVPMQATGKAFERAFAFRRAIGEELRARLDAAWPERTATAAAFEGDPGFVPVDLAAADLAALCAASPIDHSVGPVAASIGGTQAGLERWDRFRREGLGHYDRLRNDASVAPPRGVSRLSPYLHHGHLPATRIAREAVQAGGSGAQKFLDELIVWRELAHNFCFHNRDRLEGDLLALLPDWARDTLHAHAADARDAAYSLESLTRGRTGDPLWDLAARALLARGELHNNVRMTWGKALAAWAPTPQRAAEWLFHLNDHHALDGNDPNSFGGLLWCLGLFDRPFEPARPVLGTLRARSPAAHARRLDLDGFARNAVARENAPRVAVIGAGIAGLAAARTLADQGIEVQVFERGRGVGGRAATRRGDGGGFDHGAQYFTARDAVFRRHVASWVDDGIVAPWQGRIVHLDGDGEVRDVDGGPRYVAVPGMRALGKHLAADLPVTLATEIRSAVREHRGWRLDTDDGTVGEGFDALIVAAPPEQALRVLDPQSPLHEPVACCTSLACWATMVAFDAPLGVDFDGAFVDDPCLAWIARDSSKPGRPEGERWVLHAAPGWSAARTEEAPEAIAQAMLAALRERLGLGDEPPLQLAAHRWRLARVDQGADAECLFDPEQRLAVCGDWCPGARIEGAFLSGIAAAARTAGSLVQA